MTKINNKLLFLVIICAGVIVYSNSLGNDFLWDDKVIVVENDYIKDLSLVREYFTSGRSMSSENLWKEGYRPLITLSYAIDYFFWKLNPFGYHLTNLTFHIFNALLLFWMATLIAKDRFIGFFSSLIFATHAVLTESVCWISGRDDVVFLFFSLFSFIMYVRFRENRRLLYYCSSVFLFLCGLLSKEMAAIIPFLFLLYDWLYGKRDKMSLMALWYLPYFLILEAYIFVRFYLTGSFTQGGYWAGGFYPTLLTMIKGVAHYIKLLFYPTGLCADHLLFPISTSIKDVSVLFSLGVIIITVFLAIALIKKARTISFGIFWFFVALGPVSNIILPVRMIIAERFLYLPSIGYAISVSALFSILYSKFKRKRALFFASVLIQILVILTYSRLTIARNKVWANSTLFFNDIINRYPNNARAHYGLAMAHTQNQEHEKAYNELKKAISYLPDERSPRFALACHFISEKKLDEAMREMQYLVKMFPDSPENYLKLAQIYELQEDYSEAKNQYMRILAFSDSNPGARFGLAKLFILNNDFESAANEYELLISNKIQHNTILNYTMIHLELGYLYASLGKHAEARNVWTKVRNEYRDSKILHEISKFLIDETSQDDLEKYMEGWPKKSHSAVFYFIAVKKELEKDIKNAKVYYERCRDTIHEDQKVPRAILKKRIENLDKEISTQYEMQS